MSTESEEETHCRLARESALREAAWHGRLDDVRRLLGERVGLVPNDNGLNPLHCASAEGHLDVVTELLKVDGFDVNARDAFGQTSLNLACRYGHAPIVSALIDNSANVGFCQIEGLSPLHVACGSENATIVRILVQNGADISAKDHQGLTPLHMACWFGKVECARLLLEMGADMAAKDAIGLTPLHYPSQNGQDAIVRLLLEKGSCVDATNSFGQTPLYYVCWKGHINIARILIDSNAEVNAKEPEHGLLPLHMASAYGHAVVVRLLLNRGARIHCKTKAGNTAYRLAKKANHLEAAQVLREFVTNRFELVPWMAANHGRFKRLRDEFVLSGK